MVHLIKCDIEGSEFAFLESYGDLLRKTRRMAIEFHSHFGDIAKATDTLRGMGFSKVSVLRESAMAPTIYFSRAVVITVFILAPLTATSVYIFSAVMSQSPPAPNLTALPSCLVLGGSDDQLSLRPSASYGR